MVETELLTEEQKKFLDECYDEFKDRYTMNDEDYANYSEAPPPIMEPAFQRGEKRHRHDSNPYESNYRRPRYDGDHSGSSYFHYSEHRRRRYH